MKDSSFLQPPPQQANDSTRIPGNHRQLALDFPKQSLEKTQDHPLKEKALQAKGMKSHL